MFKGKIRVVLKWFGWSLAGVVGLLVAVFFAIRTPFVLSRLLPPVQKVLERDFNLKTKISQLAIDPFARVSLGGVEAQWADPELGQAEVKVENLLIRFSFWEILNRRLQVSQIEVNNPQIKAQLKLNDTQEVKPPENPLALLRKLVTEPPVALNVDSVRIKGMKLDLSLRQGAKNIQFAAEPLFLDTELHVVPKKIEAALSVSLGSSEIVSQSRGTIRFNATNLAPVVPSLALELPVSTGFATRVVLSFEEPKSPFVALGDLKFALAGEKIQLNSRLEKAGQFKLEAGKIDLNVTKPEETRLALAQIFALEAESGEAFVKKVPESVFHSLADLTLSLRNKVELERIKVNARLPSEGIDAGLSFSMSAPVDFSLGEKSLELNSTDNPITLSVSDIRLQGKAFAALNQQIKLQQLAGTRIETPLRLSLAAPQYARLKKPLEGVRLEELFIEPKLVLGVNNPQFLKARVDVAQLPSGEFKLNTGASVVLKDYLLKLIPQLKPLPENVGWLDLNADVAMKIMTPWVDLQKLVDAAGKEPRSLEIKYAIDLNQTSLPPKGSPTALQLAGGIQIRGDAKVNAPVELRSAQVNTQIDWNKQPLLNNKMAIENAVGKLGVRGETHVHALLRLRKLTPLADALGMLGGTKINLNWSVQLPHGAKSILVAQLPPPLLLNADVGVTASVQPVERPAKSLFEDHFLLLDGPVTAGVTATLRRGLAKVSVKYALPRVGTAKLAVVDKLSGQVNLEARTDLSTGVNATVEANLQELAPAKSFELPQDVAPYLKVIAAKLKLKTDIKNRVDLERVDVSAGSGKFIASLKGGTDLKATNSRFDGQLMVRPPELFRYGIRAQDRVNLDGLIRVNWELTQKEQKSLRLRGNVNLDNFSAQHKLGGLRRVSGRIPFQQDLELPNFKSLRWAYLIRDNPFKRVDTSKFVPLTLDDSLLTVVEVNAIERKFGPLRARVSLLQNMLTIDKLDADIFEGVLAGQGFIDIQPSRFVAGLQGRVTKLNTALLSSKPEKMAAAPLSARLALILDLSKALIEGRADVTEIGKNQLLALIDVLDPSGADSLLNKARLALSVGYPRSLGMQMQQGLLDLDIGLGGVLEQQFKISNLPLTPIVNAKTQDLVKTIREVPIQ
ncbi:MAG: hypothetical protein FJY29_00770 [Betaproteobacteria bacterium]|nr:hypothetical protein [Betaproteobacteria bacterium]